MKLLANRWNRLRPNQTRISFYQLVPSLNTMNLIESASGNYTLQFPVNPEDGDIFYLKDISTVLNTSNPIRVRSIHAIEYMPGSFGEGPFDGEAGNTVSGVREWTYIEDKKLWGITHWI